MKYDFTYFNPTRIHFGKNALSNLASEVSEYGENVLLVYGKGSVKKSGLYDEIIGILKLTSSTFSSLFSIKVEI